MSNATIAGRSAMRVRNRLVAAIFPYPRRLRALLAPLVLAEWLGLRPLIERLAPGSMREWIRLLPPLTGRRRSIISDYAGRACR